MESLRKEKDGAGSLSSVRSSQTLQKVFHSGLRRSESSQRKSSCRSNLELKLCDPDGDPITCALSLAVLAPGPLGLPRSSALAFWDLRICGLEGVSQKRGVHKAVQEMHPHLPWEVWNFPGVWCAVR